MIDTIPMKIELLARYNDQLKIVLEQIHDLELEIIEHDGRTAELYDHWQGEWPEYLELLTEMGNPMADSLINTSIKADRFNRSMMGIGIDMTSQAKIRDSGGME